MEDEIASDWPWDHPVFPLPMAVQLQEERENIIYLIDF